MMRIFVAGGSGVVGRLLLPKLLKAGHEVVAITRSSHHANVMKSLGARVLIADVFHRESILAAVTTAKPDAIIHQLTSLRDMNFAETSRIRKGGTQNLVFAALAAGVNRIVAQSISWAYEPGDRPASEEVALDVNAPEPRKRMVNSICALETAVKGMPEYVILRYGLFYGPGTWYERNGFIAEQVLCQKVAATDGVSSFIHVEDAASAAILALKWPSGPVNIVDDEPASAAEWLPVYANALGAPRPIYKSGKERGERGALNTKARFQYDWQPMYPTWRSGFLQSLSVVK